VNCATVTPVITEVKVMTSSVLLIDDDDDELLDDEELLLWLLLLHDEDDDEGSLQVILLDVPCVQKRAVVHL
jgi:hypothetical protein